MDLRADRGSPYSRQQVPVFEVDEDEATVRLIGGEGGNATLVRKGESWLLDAY